MTHLSQLQLSMLADKALPTDETSAATEHVESCASCRLKLAAAQSEAQLIASALQIETCDESLEANMPKFSRPVTLRGFALANLGTGLAIWLAQFLWKTLFGELIINATTWATSIYLPDIYATTSAAALYFIEEGMTMFDAYLGFVIASLLTAALLWYLLMYRKARASMGACLLVLMIGTMVAPEFAVALEIRRGEGVVTVAKSETIDDTLIIAGETVVVAGVITGDLVVAARSIDISGTVEGNVLTFAELVTISGKVGGFALGAASSYDLRGATVAGDLWAAGDKVTIDSATRVGRNATVASENASIDGQVTKDLFAFAETVELSGVLGEDMEVFADSVKLLGEAHVGGNVRFHSGNEDKLYRSEAAKIDGEVEFLALSDEFQKKNRYASGAFYLWQLAHLIGAFLVGVTFLWLVPGYRSASIGAGIDALKTAGVGFLFMISVPIAALLAAITLVGIPLSFISVAAWLVCLYLAKIAVGVVVGRMVLSQSSNFVWTLLVGLVIVMVAVNLPFIGGIINLMLTIIGLGLVAQYLIGLLSARNTGGMSPA